MAFEPIVIELTEPIRYGSEEITRIEFNIPMRGKHIKGINIEAVTTDDLAKVAGRLTGYPPSVIEDLLSPDYLRVIGVVSGFFGAGHETGTEG